jgi:predicted dehydrogenase
MRASTQHPARIAIVGAGSFGARHLQALARIDRPLHVDVVDPDAAARQRAGALLSEVGGLKAGAVTWHSDVSAMPVPDVAIVATHARQRAGTVADLVRMGARQLLLEKVLFNRMADYDLTDRLFGEHAVRVWVNCARRAYPRMGNLVDLFGGRPVNYSVSGAGWGLATNVIHHLDEFALLCGSSDLVVSAKSLLPGAYPAKRPGHVEFFGTLRATAANGSQFVATCTGGSEAIPGDRVVTIEADGRSATIRQAAQTMTVREGSPERTEPYPISLQSEATAAHINSILDGGAPELPDYATAAKLHRAMLTAFIGHLRRSGGDPALEECAIT